jgi:hypothetical protein
MKHAGDHFEEAGVIGGGGFDGHRDRWSGQHAQAAIMAGHEALEERRIKPVEIGDGVVDRESRL